MSRSARRRRRTVTPRHQQVRSAAEEGFSRSAISSGMGDVSPDVPSFPRTEKAADAALVAGLAVHDPSATTAFVQRFQGRVFGLALAITRDRAAAEDVAQEAFVRAWRAASTYDPRRGGVLTWLLTITRNAAIDAVRARRSTPVEPEVMESLLREAMVTRDSAETALLRVESDRAIRHLGMIPVEQARAVTLAVIGGCTALEVSAHEQIPLGTAKTRIRTGLRRLRTAMEEETGV
jgi:RNA polymerase sigma factor (sigma-70 family)